MNWSLVDLNLSSKHLFWRLLLQNKLNYNWHNRTNKKQILAMLSLELNFIHYEALFQVLLNLYNIVEVYKNI